MASVAALNGVILKVLNRHLKSEPHEHKEITINEAKHEIVSSDLDFLVRDTSSSLLAARVILTLRELSHSNGEGGQPTTKLAAHITTTANPDPSSPSTLVLLDEESQANGEDYAATAPHRASTIPTHPPTGSSRINSSRRPLADTYREYISTFMADPPATALASLPRFLHQPVTHNRRAIGVEEYHGLIQEARGAIPDIGCEIVDLIADEERQVVAARLEFRGTLVRPFAGAQPPAGGGLPVRIGEIVFYWFDGGKLREVVSLVDLKGLKDQAQAQS